MPSFKLQFDCENAAFTDNAEGEIARILREIADALEQGDDCGIVRDINGNSIGTCELRGL